MQRKLLPFSVAVRPVLSKRPRPGTKGKAACVLCGVVLDKKVVRCGRCGGGCYCGVKCQQGVRLLSLSVGLVFAGALAVHRGHDWGHAAHARAGHWKLHRPECTSWCVTRNSKSGHQLIQNT